MSQAPLILLLRPLAFSTPAFLLSTALLVASYLCLYRWLQRNKPGPKRWPLLGASIELFVNYGRMHDWLLGYFEKATTVTVPLLGSTCYTYTTDPRNVEYILKSNFSNFPKGKLFNEVMHPLLGNGIFNTDGDVWKKQRKTASFEFSSKVLRDFSTVTFRDYALRLADILAQAADTKHTLEMQDLFMRLTLDSICKIGFGVETCSLLPHLPEVPFAKAFDEANYIVTLRFVDPLWKLKRLLKVGNEALLIHSVQVLDDFTYQVIQTRRTEMEGVKVLGTQETKSDLLSRFIILSEDLENHMDDRSLRDLVLNFVIAGRDTTAVSLSWFLYMIIMHPDVADKIHDELCAFESECLKKQDASNCINMEPHKSCFNEQVADFASLLTYNSLLNLHYLHAAITETLRLYPAVPQDPKGILADDILPDGTQLRKGGLVAYVPYSMGRMAHLWGPDAHEYKPERWLKDGVFQHVSPFKFCVFQAGPRICLGKDSAYLQMKITAAILCRFFSFKLVSGLSMTYRIMAILHMSQGLEVIPCKW